MWRWWVDLNRQEQGTTAVEYAVLMGLIILACGFAVQSVGSAIETTFETISGQMPSPSVPMPASAKQSSMQSAQSAPSGS